MSSPLQEAPAGIRRATGASEVMEDEISMRSASRDMECQLQKSLAEQYCRYWRRAPQPRLQIRTTNRCIPRLLHSGNLYQLARNNGKQGKDTVIVLENPGSSLQRCREGPGHGVVVVVEGYRHLRTTAHRETRQKRAYPRHHPALPTATKNRRQYEMPRIC